VKNRYLGLKFSVNGETHYGWARLNVSFRAPHITATLTGYAYETEANKAIDAGQTKETTTSELRTPRNRKAQQVSALGVLALGSVAQSIWRREETPTT
jgi:peptidoglycan hydrolase-like protein with peptidoglycan-binding domain